MKFFWGGHKTGSKRNVLAREASKITIKSMFSGDKKERVMGIEPTYPAWKAGVLPLNYTRKKYIKLKCPEPESNQ